MQNMQTRNNPAVRLQLGLVSSPIAQATVRIDSRLSQRLEGKFGLMTEKILEIRYTFQRRVFSDREWGRSKANLILALSAAQKLHEGKKDAASFHNYVLLVSYLHSVEQAHKGQKVVLSGMDARQLAVEIGVMAFFHNLGGKAQIKQHEIRAIAPDVDERAVQLVRQGENPYSLAGIESSWKYLEPSDKRHKVAEQLVALNKLHGGKISVNVWRNAEGSLYDNVVRDNPYAIYSIVDQLPDLIFYDRIPLKTMAEDVRELLRIGVRKHPLFGIAGKYSIGVAAIASSLNRKGQAAQVPEMTLAADAKEKVYTVYPDKPDGLIAFALEHYKKGGYKNTTEMKNSKEDGKLYFKLYRTPGLLKKVRKKIARLEQTDAKQQPKGRMEIAPGKKRSNGQHEPDYSAKNDHDVASMASKKRASCSTDEDFVARYPALAAVVLGRKLHAGVNLKKLKKLLNSASRRKRQYRLAA